MIEMTAQDNLQSSSHLLSLAYQTDPDSEPMKKRLMFFVALFFFSTLMSAAHEQVIFFSLLKTFRQFSSFQIEIVPSS